MKPAEPGLAALAEDVIARAVISKLTIVTAESCTAGALTNLLSSIPGAGDVLHGGFVSYSKDFKIGCLGVPAELIAAQSAVSRDVALAMARCALERSPGADVAVAITGVLGPKEDEDGNPVGLLYVAAVRGTRIEAGKRSGAKEQSAVRREALECALELLDRITADDSPSA